MADELTPTDFPQEEIPAATKKTIRSCLRAHLVLMLAASAVIWFPVFFVLYGGIQAVLLLWLLKSNAASGFRRRSVYFFTLLQMVYTITLLYVGAYAFCDVTGMGGLPLDCMRGTIFTNPEFFFIAPAVFPNALYLPLVLVWCVVYAIRKVLKK